ncbi:preprotein translocase subunit SecY [Mycoplasmopsis lipofaciens]|uniref:preprotein translocase subunit SecY n=1 Tax=Mycoplasmopsis lipofaciens TaxID=114884 RepID=UPI000AB43F97|nr:preprotein translocase subunit SecY [Mycoplasmopsis lipofaciens]
MRKLFSNLNYSFSKFWFKLKHFWVRFWKSKEMLKKILFTLILLSIYIVATTITAPFVKLNNSNELSNDAFFNTLNLVGGGGLKSFSLVALGISPFINASLIMSLLQTRAFPAVQKLSQSGPQGRRKLNIITRILTLIIAFPQAILLTKSLAFGENPFIRLEPITGTVSSLGVTTYFILPMILIGGSLFSLFIAEQITNKGIGNGTSLIIFVGISFQLPGQFKGAFNYFVGSDSSTTQFVGALKFLTYLFVYASLLFVIALIYNSERHVPIQQIGAGRSRNLNEMGKLPIKLNPGGIMPIIFATMLISFPLMIARILPDTNSAKLWMNENLNFTKPLGLSLLVVITFFFSFIMGIQQSRVDKISEDFAKNSTFIPGIQPGEQTEDYLIGIVMRLSTFSGFYLVLLASWQYLMIIVLKLPAVIAFGGTGMMILVTVSLETIQQFLARKKTTKLAKQKLLSRAVSEKIAFENKYKEVDPFDTDSKQDKNITKTNGDGLLW